MHALLLRRRCFTLIELIMVIVIVGILASIAVPRMVNLRKSAQQASCFGSAGAIQTALSSYYVRKSVTGSSVFPRTLTDPMLVSYISEGVLPTHPMNWDWDTYYNTFDSTVDGPERFEFYIGRDGTYGACTEF